MTSVPKTLPAKNIKFSSIINFYNNQLIDNGIATKEQLDDFSKIWDTNCADIISIQSQYIDYETTHIQNYKKKIKEIQNFNKTNAKLLARHTLNIDRWEKKLFKKLYKFIINDTDIRQFIIDHDINLLHIPNPNNLLTLQLLQDQNTLLPQHIPIIAKQILTLNPLLPQLLNLNTRPTLPNYNYYNNNNNNNTVHLTKETTTKSSDLTDVNITNIDNKEYLVDKNNKVYNVDSLDHIGNINSDKDGNIIMPITINEN
jgi:hypothetical protein